MVYRENRMELKKIAFGWIKDALIKIPKGTWILIADGYTDYYDWHAAQGIQKEVKSAYLEQGGTIAFTYLVTNGKTKIIRPEQVICSQCNIISSKQGMTGGVCFFCNKDLLVTLAIGRCY